MPVFGRFKGNSGRSRAILAASGIVVATLVGACSPGAPGASGGTSAAGAGASPGVPVTVLTPAKSGHATAANQASKPFRATKTRWPSAASASVVVRAAGPGQAAGPVTQVAGTPLWVQSVPGGSHGATTAAATASVVSAVVLPHERGAALGVSGVVFQLAGSAPGSGNLRVGLDYSSFAQAYGGNYGTRLRLVEFPACALTTPQVAACRKQAPVVFTQDYKRSTVAAVVSLGSAGAGSVQSLSVGGAPVRGGLLLAATSTTGSGGGAAGAYPPTKLTPDGTWAEGGDTGAFTYSYPISLPPARGGLVPPVTLGYNSQAVDGKTAATQAQSNWLGDGWSTPDSNITLQTTSCGDHPEGKAANFSTGDSCYAGESCSCPSTAPIPRWSSRPRPPPAG